MPIRRRIDPALATANRRSGLKAVAVVVAGTAALGVGLALANLGSLNSGEPAQIAAATVRSSSSDGRHHITETTIGCGDDADLSRLVRYQVENDPQLMKIEAQKLVVAGRCALLTAGETVIRVKSGFTMAKVRRPGESEEWWVVAERLR